MDNLTSELAALAEELVAAETESIRLQAKISGLRAQRDSLAAALAAQRSTATSGGASDEPLHLDAVKKRTEAIEALLRHAAGSALTIDQVRDGLNEHWTDTSNYAVVASTLNLLHRTGRISKVARGKYMAA